MGSKLNWEGQDMEIQQIWSESKRRRRDDEIPIDVVEEILLKLPVKSVVRLQAVSRYWRYLIRSRNFEVRYMIHQKTKDPKLLMVCDDLVDRLFLTLFYRSMVLETKWASLEFQKSLNYLGFRGFLEISEACDGLVCVYGLTKAVAVINPVTTRHKALPLAKIQRQHRKHPEDPNATYVTCLSIPLLGFGKDSVTGGYKLVWLYNDYPNKKKKVVRCEVLDLEKGIWRFVSTSPLNHHRVLCNPRPTFVNGSFYWLTRDEENTQTKLIVFDIHTELFHVTQTPHFITPEAFGTKIGLCNLNGRLCLSELKKGDCKQEFWWMVNDDNKWEKIFTVDLHSTCTWFDGITSHPLTPLVISRHKKVILSLNGRPNLVVFDLNRKNYHLYHSGYYGLVVPYFPSLKLEPKD